MALRSVLTTEQCIRETHQIVELEIKTAQSHSVLVWRASDAVTARVRFRSRAGDCFEVMSARLPWPVISNASAALEEEATT